MKTKYRIIKIVRPQYTTKYVIQFRFCFLWFDLDHNANPIQSSYLSMDDAVKDLKDVKEGVKKSTVYMD